MGVLGQESSLLDRQEEAISARFEQALLDRIRPLVTRSVVEEHRTNPIGAHSFELDLVLGYLRRHGNPEMDQLLIVATKPEEEFKVGEHPTRKPEVPIDLKEPSFSSVEEATHAIFLKRLQSLDLEIRDDGVEG